ncbi:uncharacterized protein LOC119838893 [Zerene cesonia]|uniref:uncharacterized protein LOC119838893 n=1 Tax=Zerene cesonia TaxID=33412 RepID=UPI0018E57585|nr:uncharacterized protein LOC119838893 [Zerene cesonia]
MLRTTLSKIKKVCTLAIVPRILQGEAKYVQKKLAKNSIIASRATKSTSSKNSGSKDDAEHKNPVDKQPIQILEKPDDNLNKSVAQPPDDNCEVCNRIINKIFENETVGKPLEQATVNATAKADTEELEQKMEKLEETPIVPSPLEDQTTPRVIGNQQVLSSMTEAEFSESKRYDSSFDELAKKCLGVPPNDVDEYIIKELRQYYEQTKGDVNAGTSNERYYSQVLYNPEVIHLGKVNSATEAANVLHDFKDEDNEDRFIHVYKAEITQPLLFDILSTYEEETDLNRHLLERPSFETPLLLNPYDNNLMFPLDDYELRKDLILEAPKVEETITVQESEVTKNEAMPPAEMEIESEQPAISKQLQGTVAGISLGVPENISTPESPHTSKITGIENKAFVYTQHSHRPPTEPPPDWQTQIGQHSDRQPVTPNTSISGKIPEMEKKRRQHTSDSAISSHQNLHDLYMIGISNEISDIPEIKAENLSSNVFSSKYLELQDENEISAYVRRDPYTHFIIEPEPKQEQEEVITKADNIANVCSDDVKKVETAQNLEGKIAATTGPIPSISESEIPLKEMLRRIRERHRQELCRDFFQEASQFQLSTACKPKMPFPSPCKPIPKEKPKSECPPPPKSPEKTDPCAPKKDNPCSKFTQLGNQIYNSICFIRLTHFNSFGNVQTMPIINYQPYKQYSKAISTTTLQIHCLKENTIDALDVDHMGDVILARDYEPWTPIPSWPIPKKDQKKKLVCPKEGCKLLPPPPLHPADKDKPCVSFPKKTFSLAELFEHQPVTSARY